MQRFLLLNSQTFGSKSYVLWYSYCHIVKLNIVDAIFTVAEFGNSNKVYEIFLLNFSIWGMTYKLKVIRIQGLQLNFKHYPYSLNCILPWSSYMETWFNWIHTSLYDISYYYAEILTKDHLFLPNKTGKFNKRYI